MGEFLRAFTNISSNWANNGESNVDQDNEFVGQTIELKGHRLRVERVLAEGGFGFVFKVKDGHSQETYALKRLIASDKESKKDIINEIQILTKLQPHPHIMKFISWGQMDNNVYLVLCELCSGGSLSDLAFPLATTQQLNRILYQTANAISHVHRYNIIHRDLKPQNILFDNKGFVKLCDFGSATMDSYHPNSDWTPVQRSLVEDEMGRKTTPMYRPPEILDTYLHLKINKSMDIWSFGCMIYFVKFNKHPFEDSAKLRIINCNYTFPSNYVEDVHTELIKRCLKIDPDERITIEGIIEELERNFVDLIAPCVQPKQSSPILTGLTRNLLSHSSNHLNATNNVQQAQQIHSPGSAQSATSFGSVGLSGFTKYLKDTSNKVMQTVQQSINKQDLDLTYLTSNLIVMSYPAEGLESAYRNHSEDVRAYLDSKKCPYMIVNVSGRTYGSYKFGHNTKLINANESWKETNKISSFVELIDICDKISDWLVEQKDKKLVIVHCIDGKLNSSILVSSFLLYIGMFKSYEASSNFFAVRRCPIDLNAAHRRYLDYITNFNLKNKTDLFDKKSEKVIIKSVIMNGIPLFSKNRDGCRPVLEIFTEKDKRIFSSLKDYEQLIVYNKVCDSRVHWKDLNIPCNSKNDLYAVIYHARAGLGSRMLQTKLITSIRICSVQFNLTMERKVNAGTQILKFNLINLDSIDEVDRYPREFQISFELDFTGTVMENEKLPDRLTETACDIMNLFGNQAEFEECKDTFNCKRPRIHDSLKTDVKSSQSSPNLCPRNVGLEERASSNSNLRTSSQNTSSSNSSINSNKNKESPINDLLNLNLNGSSQQSPQSTNQSNSQPQQANIPCDLLGNFNMKNIDLLNDLMSNDKSSQQRPTNTSNLDLLNELFHNENKQNNESANNSLPTAGPDLLTEPNVRPNGAYSNEAASNASNLDPFDDLFGNQASNSSSQSNGIPRFTLSSTQPPLKPTQTKPTTSNANIPKQFSTTTNSNAFKQQSKPDYNRAFFHEQPSQSNNGPKLPDDAFGDLLSGFSKNPQNDWNKNSGKSMAQLKREEMLRDGTIDPLKLRINDWKENKTRNIRALLGSLHTVVWADCNWTPIGIHQLVNATDVKKMYRKACLAVHPDKLMGTEHEELAKLIFVELNDAWSEFEKQT